MISNQQKSDIMASVSRLTCQPIDLVETFYDHLFETAPETESLFRGDMHAQYEKLSDTIMLVVNALDNLPQLVVTVEELGVRHVGYGVQAHHYDAVGASLIHALAHHVADWTEREQDAWIKLYGFLADLMLTGGADYMQKAG